MEVCLVCRLTRRGWGAGAGGGPVGWATELPEKMWNPLEVKWQGTECSDEQL